MFQLWNLVGYHVKENPLTTSKETKSRQAILLKTNRIKGNLKTFQPFLKLQGLQSSPAGCLDYDFQKYPKIIPIKQITRETKRFISPVYES